VEVAIRYHLSVTTSTLFLIIKNGQICEDLIEISLQFSFILKHAY